MRTLRPLALTATLALFLCGCLGPRADRNALSTLEASKANVTTALHAWNEYLGREIAKADAQPEPLRSERRADLQKTERRILAALDDFNRALASVDAAWDAYDAARQSDSAGSPSLTPVKRAIFQVQTISNSLVEIVRLWLTTSPSTP